MEDEREDKRDDLQVQIALLRTKIRGRLRAARESEITAHLFTVLRGQIQEYMTEMEIRVTKLQLSPSSGDQAVELEEEWLTEQVSYHREMEEIGSVLIPVEYGTYYDQTPTPSSPDFIAGSRVSSFTVKPPQVQITGPTFSGLEMDSDRMAFRNFLSRFENCVVGMANDAERLNFLKCSLSDRPLLLINHLHVTNRNYEMAINVLKDEYLDVDEIIDQIFQDIIDFIPKRDKSYVDLRNFLSRTGSLLSELGSSFDCDFSNDLSAGARLMAKILFAKFSRELKGEVIQLSGKRIPPLSSLLRETGEAIKRLLIKGSGLPGLRYRDEQSSPVNPPQRPRSAFVRRDSSFQIASNLGPSQNVPPILSVTFGSSTTITINCLLDTGSSRTFLSGKVLKHFNCIDSYGLDCDIRLSTLLGECNKRFREVTLRTDLGTGNIQPFPVLVDDDLDLSINVPHLDLLLDEFQEANYTLAGRFERNSYHVPIMGIIGLDLIRYLRPFQLVPCLQGWAFSIPAGLVPFGKVESFYSDCQSPLVEDARLPLQHVLNDGALVEESVNPAYQSPPVEDASLPFLSVLDDTPQVEHSYLCFVLESEPTYADPLAEFFPDSQVQRGLELMFSVESLGIPEQERFSDYDQKKIAQFQETIVLKDSKYYVQLPWHTDKLAQVPSNHSVSLRILERVTHSLEKKGMYQEYLEVFRQQERDGIIEEIVVPSHRFNDYIWIPHRPVFKTDPAATTKLRPVFNCSLKTGSSLSLNEAAYPGVNLTADMLKLLMSFRTDDYVLLADIKKAFLMVRLELEADRNRFCFFLKDGDRLRCFRYSTIIFGFVSSPFILSCILKYHAAQFPLDPCRSMMEDQFYVDNLVATEADPTRLVELYTLSRERLQKGGFELQSCNSNSCDLRDKMASDGTLSGHGEDWERVLGYRYSPFMEKICVAPIEPNVNASTKRQILSEAAKLFDPLSLCLPVTVRSRVLIKELWKRGLNWDEQVPQEFQSQWRSLAQDLYGLNRIHFDRRTVRPHQVGELSVFCDASAEAYGFAAYVSQDQHSELVFAKAKVSPMKNKSLPTLELMAVFLALKCLPVILDCCKGFKPSKLYIATDAQVVLSWIISKTMNSKNIFARNRLQDVLQMSEALETQFNLTPFFKYVQTTQNPADLITRGLSLGKFKSNLEFWRHGPTWMNGDGDPWPVQELPCLSRHSQLIARASVNTSVVLEEAYHSIIDLERFSRFPRLLRVTSLVFKFINILRRREEDEERKASLYLLGVMQRQAFVKELEFLQNPDGKPLPHLVRDLDLFIDKVGLIRSSGRLNRSPHLEYEVKNPILLGKNHHLTRLIILDCHTRSSHLGAGSTLTELRSSGYWIPQGRQAVKRALASCSLCKRFNSRPVLPPNVASLPAPRVDLEIPFKNTGIDYTGHIWVKERASSKKMYLLLFTCLSVRAIHIEVVPDMTILSFFQALVRFTNLYGIPSALYCDNAKTFLGSGKWFSCLSQYHEYQEAFGTCCIKLKTIPLFSPWFGGAWERCIKTVKNCLDKLVGRKSLDYFSLLTTVSDIQRAVNNRPLTYRQSADRELEPITPNIFLKPNKNPGLLLRTEESNQSASMHPSRRRLIESMEQRNNWLDEFHHMWYKEYLLGLREGSRGRSRIPFRNRLKTDDVVLVKSPLKPRPFWILGTILELYAGDDGVIRSARVKQGDGTVRVHSLKHLFPLELSLSPDSIEETESASPLSPEARPRSMNTDPPSEDEAWLCPTCDSPPGNLDMIGCDNCDEWYHFACVGLNVPPPERQKWYCPECAPKKKRRGRPSLLPA